MTALRTIERDLQTLADNATPEQPVDPHELRIIARKVGAQAEMVEQGLSE
jgi:hypothetical protein